MKRITNIMRVNQFQCHHEVDMYSSVIIRIGSELPNLHTHTHTSLCKRKYTYVNTHACV